jgi:hypothetical protein
VFEDAEDHIATPAEACKEYARNYGSDHPEQAWILTDFDTWEPNPFYHGPPVQHPEDDRPEVENYQPPQPCFIVDSFAAFDDAGTEDVPF